VKYGYVVNQRFKGTTASIFRVEEYKPSHKATEPDSKLVKIIIANIPVGRMDCHAVVHAAVARVRAWVRSCGG
jgi:hypothetical protein